MQNRKSVKRKVYSTACKGYHLDCDGILEEQWYVLQGKYTREQAMKFLRKQESDSTIVITSVEYDCDVYEMPFEEFISIASLVQD